MPNTLKSMSLTKQPHLPRPPRVEIMVTAEHIQTNMERNSHHCMIAEAVKAAVPKARSVAVDLATIRWTDPERELRYTYLTPRIGQIGLINFDRGVKPEPFSFVLSGGHVARATRYRGKAAAVPDARWKPVKQILRAAVDAATLSEVATELGSPERTVRSRLSDSSRPPSAEFVAKAEEWVKSDPARADELAALTAAEPPPVKSEAHRIPARKTLRHSSGNEAPQIVGGRPPPNPTNNLARRRAFGIHAFVE